MLNHALALVTVLFIYVCSRCFLYLICDQNDHAFSVPDPRCYYGSVCRAFMGPQQFGIWPKYSVNGCKRWYNTCGKVVKAHSHHLDNYFENVFRAKSDENLFKGSLKAAMIQQSEIQRAHCCSIDGNCCYNGLPHKWLIKLQGSELLSFHFLQYQKPRRLIWWSLPHRITTSDVDEFKYVPLLFHWIVAAT